MDQFVMAVTGLGDDMGWAVCPKLNLETKVFLIKAGIDVLKSAER